MNHPPIGFYPLTHTDVNGTQCTTLPSDEQEILAWDAANPQKGEMRGAFLIAGDERIFLQNGLVRASFTHWKGLQETNEVGAAIALTPEPSLIDPCKTMSLVGGTNDAMNRDEKLANLRADHDKHYQATLDKVMPIEKAEAIIAAADAAHHKAFEQADAEKAMDLADPKVLKAAQQKYLDGIDAQKEMNAMLKEHNRIAELLKAKESFAETTKAFRTDCYSNEASALAELTEQLDRVIGLKVSFTAAEAMSNAAEFLRRYAPDNHGNPTHVRYQEPYIIVRGLSFEELEDAVESAYEEGYVALGGLTVLPEEGDPAAPRFAQAMVLK